MTILKNFLHRLIRNPGENLPSRVLLAPLTFLSFLYGLAVSVRVYFYRKGIYRSHSLPCRVVSVGNLTLGGTGKTPFAILLAEMILRRGYRAAVLSRGYKGKYEGACALVSDGERILMDPLQAGDEPSLLARKLKGVPVIVGRERWVAGRLAIDRFRTEVLVLDDGYQHLALKRDLNFLLLDSFSPFGNGRLFPRGELREPLSQVRRADALILTKGGADDKIINLGKRFMNLPEGRPVFRVRYEPEEIIVWGEERALLPLHLKGKKVLAFSGLARPESFEKTLQGLEAEIVGFEPFPDHYAYEGKDLERLVEKAMRAGAEAMVTTEKDRVRIKNFPPGRIPLWSLSVRHVFPGEDLARFETFLFERLGLKA
jgi:tetraacyldisaccharide 4'-kinase